MRKRYPSIERLLAALPDGTLAAELCECFVEVESPQEARQNLQSVLDKHLAELLEPHSKDKES